MKRFAILLLAVSTSACLAPASTACPAASPAFQGEWWGDATVTLSSGNVLAYPVAMFATVDGHTVLVDGVCPDGTGAFRAFASGTTATWAEGGVEVRCQDPSGRCSGGLLFTSATLTASVAALHMEMSATCDGEPANAALASVRVEGVSHH
jgi:hypothetical protein